MSSPRGVLEDYWEDCFTWSGVESSTCKGVITHRGPGGLSREDHLTWSGVESSTHKGVTHGVLEEMERLVSLM